MTRHCTRCKRAIPAGEGVLLTAHDTGSGAQVHATYACDGCAPPDPEPARPYQPPRAPAGFHDRATT